MTTPRIAAVHTDEVILCRRQLLERGLSDADLRAMVRSGRLARVRTGVYAQASRWATASSDDHYRWLVTGLLARAQRHTQCKPWVASHHAALALHGLPLFQVDLSHVDAVAPTVTTKTRAGLHLHHLPGVSPVETLGGAAVPIAHAIVQTATSSGVLPALAALDNALHHGGVTPRQVEAAIGSGLYRQGLTAARHTLSLSDGRAESVPETVCRYRFHLMGLSAQPQFVIRAPDNRFVARVDNLVQGVVFEYDGAVKYEGAEGRLALMREKAREDDIRAQGYPVARLVSADIQSQPVFARTVMRYLRRAA